MRIFICCLHSTNLFQFSVSFGIWWDKFFMDEHSYDDRAINIYKNWIHSKIIIIHETSFSYHGIPNDKLKLLWSIFGWLVSSNFNLCITVDAKKVQKPSASALRMLSDHCAILRRKWCNFLTALPCMMWHTQIKIALQGHWTRAASSFHNRL